MSIWFKFRSSVNFDTVEIDNRASISVCELRAKILRGKNSQQQQGFDLVLSDAFTGLVYEDGDFQIPSGSSVIVKRVPGGAAPVVVSKTEALKDIRVKDSHTAKPSGGLVDGFDDFGVDTCPMPNSDFPLFDIEIHTNNFIGNEKEEVTGLRLECQKLDSSDIIQAIPRGSNQTDDEKRNLQEARVVNQMKLTKLPSSNFLAVQSSNLPLELKCFLCNTFFKDAVMIPCCQHSFCEKCIRLLLIEKGRCPKCFSSKCNVEDLLPNLSLRQAIEHFLESQILDADLDKGMDKYAPDGESGIQAKDFSCALTVGQRELELPHQSCATGNVPYGNSGDKDVKSAFPLQRPKQTNGSGGGYPKHGTMQRGYEKFPPLADFQGENQPFVVHQANTCDEAEINSNKRGRFWMNTEAGDRNFSAVGGYKKGVRHCYTCGSPDHLMRDCPVSNQNHMFQPGNGGFHGSMPDYLPSYWNGPSMPPFRPYGNMYGNPAAMMPFNPSFPVSLFGVPPYDPSMFGGMPGGPGGNMRASRQFDYFGGLQPCENSRKHSNDYMGRERLSDNEDGSAESYPQNYPEKSHEYKLEKKLKEPSLSHSGDSFTRRPVKKQQHGKYSDPDIRYTNENHEKSSHSSFAGKDKRHHAEKSNSGHKSSDPHSEPRHKNHHSESKKYHHERREHYDSESSHGNRLIQKDIKRRVESHEKHHKYSESSFERGRGYKESDIGHDSRHSRHSEKHLRDERHGNRWHMVKDGRDEKYRDHKRKRQY